MVSLQHSLSSRCADTCVIKLMHAGHPAIYQLPCLLAVHGIFGALPGPVAPQFSLGVEVQTLPFSAAFFLRRTSGATICHGVPQNFSQACGSPPFTVNAQNRDYAFVASDIHNLSESRRRNTASVFSNPADHTFSQTCASGFNHIRAVLQ